MSNNRKRSTLGQIFNVFGSAIAASAAVESGRRPIDRDLHVLGIDPRSFRTIGR